jgi:hypothetical protein
MRTPMWELDILIEQRVFVAALAAQQAVTASAVPRMKQEDLRSLVRSLEDQARPRGGGGPAVSITPELFNNLDNAAAVLTGMGIEVRRVKTS